MEPLIGMLKDGSAPVQRNAAAALGKIKDPRVVEPLIGSLKAGDSSCQPFVAGALRNITGVDLGQDFAKWRDWWEEYKEEIRSRT